MDLTAIGRIAKARWLILVAAGVLAAVVVGRLAVYQSENMPTHEAIATVTFTQDPSVYNQDDFQSLLDEQYTLATEVNSDILGQTPGPLLPWSLAEINILTKEAEIVFIGRGYSQEEADEVTMSIRDSYLALSEVGAGQQRISEEIDELTVQIGDLRTRIAEREAETPLSEEQTTQEVTRAALQTRIDSLQSQYGALGVELMNPVERTTGQVQAEMDRVLSELVRLQLELREMRPVVDAAAEQSADEQLLLDQLRLEQLQTRWTSLFTQLRDLNALATQSEVDPSPLTIMAPEGSTNQMLAVAGAVIAALIAVVGIERTRGIVWSTAEFEEEVPVITELPPRQLRLFQRPTSEPWYITVPAGKRKAGVQLIRSQLDAFQNSVVAFQGTGVFDGDTLDLSADLAMSAAVSGRNVLLLDATFSDTVTQVEYGSTADLTLLGLLDGLENDPQSALAEIKATLVSRPDDQRYLRAMRSGVGSLDAGDVLASQKFEMFLDVAREHYDLVIIAGAGFDQPTSHILAQRVDAAILLGSIGHTIDRQVDAVDRDFRARRSSLLGMVMLRRRRSRFMRWAAPRFSATLWDAIDWLKSQRVSDAAEMEDEVGTDTAQPAPRSGISFSSAIDWLKSRGATEEAELEQGQSVAEESGSEIEESVADEVGTDTGADPDDASTGDDASSDAESVTTASRSGGSGDARR